MPQELIDKLNTLYKQWLDGEICDQELVNSAALSFEALIDEKWSK